MKNALNFYTNRVAFSLKLSAHRDMGGGCTGTYEVT